MAQFIPDGYAEGNSELRALGARSRHYLARDASHWRLGVPPDGAWVPYVHLTQHNAERSVQEALDPVSAGAVAAQRRALDRRPRPRRRPFWPTLAAWLDADLSSRIAVPRLVVALFLGALAFGTYALTTYALS